MIVHKKIKIRNKKIKKEKGKKMKKGTEGFMYKNSS